MAAIATGAAAGAAAAATTSSSSDAASNTDLAAGIIVVIVIPIVVVAFLVGMVWFCIRRRRNKKRQAVLLATAKQTAENDRLAQQQQQMNSQVYSPPLESGMYQGQTQQQTRYMTEMPVYPPPGSQLSTEKDGEERHVVYSALPQATEMYSPPETAEMSTGAPPSSELDGSYGILPAGPDNDASSPMLRREHEQVYSRSWTSADGRGGGA